MGSKKTVPPYYGRDPGFAQLIKSAFDPSRAGIL